MESSNLSSSKNFLKEAPLVDWEQNHQHLLEAERTQFYEASIGVSDHCWHILSEWLFILPFLLDKSFFFVLLGFLGIEAMVVEHLELDFVVASELGFF